jgi:hypothetical protein
MFCFVVMFSFAILRNDAKFHYPVIPVVKNGIALWSKDAADK